MSTINDYFTNSMLSVAAYGEFDADMNKDIARYIQALTDTGIGKPGMSEAQARAFIGLGENNTLIAGKGFEIIHHEPDRDSGFSATVFKNHGAGEYHLAIRGTVITDVADLISDANAVLSGGATDQIISLLNYYLRLITPEEESVVQVISAGGGVFTTTDAPGLGLLDADSPVTVTGHSLGGHLATAFVKAFPVIGKTHTTYNGLGIGSGMDSLLEQVAGLYGIAPDTESPASSFPVTNLIAESGIDLVPNAIAASNQLGDSELLFIVEGVGPQNHNISRLADALAVYDLLARVDPTKPAEQQILTLGRGILDAASNRAEASLEAVVNGLGKLFGTGLDVAVGDRNQLYTGIHAIREAVPDTGSHQLVNLVQVGADDLRARAAAESDEGLAYRYALQNLLPFTVLADPGLYDRQVLAAEHFSQGYLTDRAGALGIILASNFRDRAAVRRGGRHARVGTDFIDHDADGSTERLARIAGWSQGGARTRQVRFGSDESETLYGGGEADRLYGGSGVDDTRVLKHGPRMSKLDYREAA